MIWNDARIKEWARNGGVTPYDASLVNPASLDLRLGNTVRVQHECWSYMSKSDIDWHIHGGTFDDLPLWSEPKTFDTHVMYHGDFVLCHSMEFVRIPPSVASILVLKSSKGRAGLNHSHSGWGDPGFGYSDNTINNQGAQWTFELQNLAKKPFLLVAGQPIIQMVLMNMVDAPSVDYRLTGHYVYQSGPTVAWDS